jgi:formyl-CoA transferase/CoA:oxalate CoA-transferase
MPPLEGLKVVDVDELVDRLQRAGVPCGRVRTVADAMIDPQVEARDMLLALDVPGTSPLHTVGNPIKLSESPAAAVVRPPALGEHTDDIRGAGGFPTKPTR